MGVLVLDRVVVGRRSSVGVGTRSTCGCGNAFYAVCSIAVHDKRILVNIAAFVELNG